MYVCIRCGRELSWEQQHAYHKDYELLTICPACEQGAESPRERLARIIIKQKRELGRAARAAYLGRDYTCAMTLLRSGALMETMDKVRQDVPLADILRHVQFDRSFYYSECSDSLVDDWLIELLSQAVVVDWPAETGGKDQ